MQAELQREVLNRIAVNYSLSKVSGEWIRGGICPSCGKKELYTHAQNPWVLRCGRESKCGDTFHVKDLFDDLFNDWSERYKATPEQPKATARAYLEYARGFKEELIGGWYTQEYYHDRELGIGSATVRFELPGGGYWERLIDQPHRFGKKKARFSYGTSHKGGWWCPPCVDLLAVDELWIVEGIFDAIALVHNGISAVSIMSCNNYPEKALAALAADCKTNGSKLPKLVWALDGDHAGQSYTRKWVDRAEQDDWRCSAAQILQGQRKHDWNDLHQLEQLTEEKIKEVRHHGDLLTAKTAGEKGLLMYTWRERQEFYFGFNSNLYWFKLDMTKYNKVLTELSESESVDVRTMSDFELREKALEQSGAVIRIANCYPQALYFQRNEITDESWYYFRIDFPHDGGSVKSTFTGGQVSAAAEFKKRLVSTGAGAYFTGSGQQLDRIMQDQLFGIKTVETIDYIGYSKEHQCYVLGDIAIKGGQLYQVNEEDFFEFGKLRLKSLLKTIPLEISLSENKYREEWLGWLWTAFGAKGVIALAFWVGSLYAEQIRAQYKSFPFLEITGEAGAGKSTLIQFLWKLFGRDYEGFDPSKSSVAGRSRAMGQVSGMPVVLIEGDRNEPDKAHAKSFDWDELKDFYGGGTLRTRGVKTAGNETYEPPFRGTIAISQNAAVSASEAILTRIVKLHFQRPVATDASRAAADNLNLMQTEDVSQFLVRALRLEDQMVATFGSRVGVYEKELRGLKEIRIERIAKNHAQMMALVDCLEHLMPITQAQRAEVELVLRGMAVARQQAVNADHPAVAEFWEVYEYLESLEEGPVVNHSADPKLIAINLNEFAKVAANNRQNIADLTLLRELLKESRSHKFIESSRAVHSVIRASARVEAFDKPKPGTIKCWIFKK
ncbi:Toprim-like [Halopseudomonas litoralis]|uniref:Toprim-like n=1 Tax=Halopseudomonas litoralis TaxID=797277 RepID=A0A1H1SKB5_9GAMM|nr:toprim domain-containing protein [Halopseudomonas litoralis]SDS48283.1 Toprim-like [Halopseudomonas litoralis]